MPNFDALRTGNLGALSYICRPKLAPELLYGCWPLGSNDLTDKSRYGGSAVISNASWSDSYGLMACTGTGMTFGSGRALDTTSDFSIEFMVAGTSSLSSARRSFTIGNYGISLSRENGNLFIDIKYNNGDKTWNGFSLNTLTHIAMVRRESSFRFYVQGSLFSTQTSDIGISSFSSLSRTDCAGLYICNVRFVQKALGTSSYYPVPSTLYTGYETL